MQNLLSGWLNLLKYNYKLLKIKKKLCKFTTVSKIL